MTKPKASDARSERKKGKREGIKSIEMSWKIFQEALTKTRNKALKEGYAKGLTKALAGVRECEELCQEFGCVAASLEDEIRSLKDKGEGR